MRAAFWRLSASNWRRSRRAASLREGRATPAPRLRVAECAASAPAAAAPGGSAATSALSSAQAGLGGAASAEAGKAAAINAASGLAVPTQALGVAAPAATTSLAAPSAGLSTALTTAPSTVTAPLTGMDKFKAVAKEKPLETAQFAQSMLGGQQQPQQAPVYAAPIQQGGGMPAPPSIEERLAMTGGNEPSFVPRGLFEEERAVLDDEDKLRQLQKLTLQGGF